MMFAERIGLKWWEWTDHTEALSCMVFAEQCIGSGEVDRLHSGPVLMMFAERIGLKWWEWTDHTEALSL